MDDEFQIPMAMLVVVISYILMGQLFRVKNFHLIHETSYGILAGMLVGALIKAIDVNRYHQMFKLDSSIFFFLLLPVIIFAGGYNLKKKKFLQNFKYILVFGFASTILNFLLITGLTVAVNEMGLSQVYSKREEVHVKLTTGQILLYSSTICATDSVAALTLINSDQQPKLFSLVFGEGMVNDAVSIILFKAMADMIVNKVVDFEWYTPFELIGRFLQNCVLSVLVGVIIGLFSTWLMKKCQFITRSTTSEILFAFLMAYTGYNICEQCQLSGVIGLLITGIVMSHYQTYNMSNLGKVTTRVTFDAVAQLAEAFIYVYMGFAIWDQQFVYSHRTKQLNTAAISWQFTLAQFFIVAFSRFMSIYLIYWIALITKNQNSWQLERSEMAITCYAGMVRGSVAFALIKTLSYSHNNTELNQINILQSTVLFLVCGTTVVYGTLMPAFIQFQQRSTNEKENELFLLPQPQKEPSDAQKIIKYLDDNYFKRWFIYDYERRKHQINHIKKEIKKRNLQEIFDEAITEDNEEVEEEEPEKAVRFRIDFQEHELPPKNNDKPEQWEIIKQ